MPEPLRVKNLSFNQEFILLETEDGKEASMPLEWFPRLREATMKELENYELWSDGEWIHWEKLGEDLSVEGFFSFDVTSRKAKDTIVA